MAQIKVLVGSTYGGTQEVAEDAADLLTRLGHRAVVLNAPKMSDVVAEDTDVLLICTATIGLGEIPTNLMLLYAQLKDHLPLMPGKRYGLIALGDSGYQNFANAGKLMDALMQEMQLTRVGEPLVVDACETPDPEELVNDWIEAWSGKL